MSIGLATMGMFKPCCAFRTGAGGAPPYRGDETHIVPQVLVTKFEMETINTKDKLFKHMVVKLVDDED